MLGIPELIINLRLIEHKRGGRGLEKSWEQYGGRSNVVRDYVIYCLAGFSNMVGPAPFLSKKSDAEGI